MRVSSKGQITVPREVRKAMAVEPGDELIIDVVGDGEARLRRAKGLLELAGSIKVPEDVQNMSWQEVKRKAHSSVARRAVSK